MITRFLTEEATLYRQTVGAVDVEGNPTLTSTALTVLCRLSQTSTDDNSGNGERRSTQLRLYVDADVEIDGNDRVVKDGRTFEVEGSPYLAATPRGPHHWEVTLREVTP